MSGSPRASVGKKTGVGAASRAAGPGLALRRRAMMLGLLIASFAANQQAQARCDPDAGSNVTATCTGTTLNQNPPNGYGTGNEDNLDTTVVRGATVTGTADADAIGRGIFFNTGSVTNFGTISGTAGANATGFGIAAKNTATVTSSGTISGTAGANGEGVGIFAFGNATVFNSGTISGTAGIKGLGIGINAVSATVINSGTISGTAGAGGSGAGINANSATVFNSGTISGTVGAGGFGIAAGNTATVFNSGTIIGTGGAGGEGIGIFVGATGNVATSGTIIGSSGTAIRFNAFGTAASDILRCCRARGSAAWSISAAAPTPSISGPEAGSSTPPSSTPACRA
jgi:hypothetical protein